MVDGLLSIKLLDMQNRVGLYIYYLLLLRSLEVD